MTALFTESRPTPTARRALPRRAAFWLVAIMTTALLAASSAPTPLYPVYRQEFGFSALTLTTIFASYVVALLLTLLTVGSLSDFVGRKPVLAIALVLEAGAMAVFLAADGTTWLMIARLVQGVATGAATGVLGAYLLDLQPPTGSRLGSLLNSIAPTVGLAIGAVGTGVLVQFAPHPTRLVFAVLTALFALLAVLVGALPETVRATPGVVAALRPRVAVPDRARGAFLRAMPLMIATWTLGGLVFSLVSTLLPQLFGVHSHALVGLIVAIFPATGATSAYLVRDLAPEAMARRGTVELAGGTAIFLLALALSSLSLFVAAAVVAGAGFGAGFLGSLRMMTQLVRPDERATLLSAAYLVSYLALSIPAVIAGVLATHVGLRDTSLGYGTFVATLAVAALFLSTSRPTYDS